jgi:frataxin-like iron-binding protein CyaY
MKRIKIISCIVTAAMVLGLAAGCSKTKKVTTESVEKACEALDYEEYDVGDLEDGQLEPGDIDDGIYVVIDGDDIEDLADENEASVSSIGLDEVLESDDIESAALFIKGDGLEDFADDVDGLQDIENLADAEFELIIGMQATLKDDDKVEDIMDYLEDMLDEYDLDVDDLTAQEYYRSKTEGYLKFNIDIQELWAIAQENDDLMDLLEEADMEDQIEDLFDSVSGNICVSYQISGNNLIVVIGAAFNSKGDSLNDMCSKLGIDNPSKLKTNEVFAEGIIDSLVSNVAKYMSYAYAAEAEYNGF